MGKGRILVVDDEKDIRDTFQEILEYHGYEVNTSWDYYKTEELVRNKQFDTVFADLFLPEMDGIELLKKIKENQPDTPVIIFTGYPTVNTASQAVRLDAYDYLQKPVTLETLIRVTKRAVETKKLREEKKRIEKENKIYQDNLEELVKERTKQFLESEERYRSFFEGSRDAIYITTQDDKFIDVNLSMLDLFGYTRDEMLNMNKGDLYADPINGFEFQKEMEKRGSVRNYELKLRKKDKTEIDCLLTSAMRRDKSGKIIEYQGIIRDITARKRAGRELGLRDRILEAVGFAAGQFLKETDWEQSINEVLERLGKAGKVSRVYVFEDHPGQSDTLLARQQFEWVSPEIEPLIDNPKAQVFPYHAGGFERWKDILQRGNVISGHINDFPTKEREILELQDIKSVLAVPIFVGQSYWGFIGIDECQREREWSRVEIEAVEVAAGTLGAALQNKQQVMERLRLVTAIEQSSEGIIITDTEGIIQYVNPAFEAITGYTGEEILGQDTKVLKSGQHDTAFYKRMWETITKGEIWHGHLINKKRDGTQYEEETTISPVKNPEGKILNYVAIKRDVTEKKRLESIAQTANLMDNLGYIFSGIRHELGNPINSIKMTLSVLDKDLETFSGETVHEFVARSLDQLSRVEYLLQALRNFSMFESPRIQNLQMHVFMKKFLQLFLEDFKKNGIKAKITLSSDAKWGLTDPRTLHQIMLNLLNNASYALVGRKTPKITISLRKSQGLILIGVEDNGCGMSEEQYKNLFRPFFTSKPNGTGLGLVIVKKMLTKMNSTIGIESQEDVGTKVIVSIPEGNGEFS